MRLRGKTLQGVIYLKGYSESFIDFYFPYFQCQCTALHYRILKSYILKSERKISAATNFPIWDHLARWIDMWLILKIKYVLYPITVHSFSNIDCSRWQTVCSCSYQLSECSSRLYQHNKFGANCYTLIFSLNRKDYHVGVGMLLKKKKGIKLYLICCPQLRKIITLQIWVLDNYKLASRGENQVTQWPSKSSSQCTENKIIIQTLLNYCI